MSQISASPRGDLTSRGPKGAAGRQARGGLTAVPVNPMLVPMPRTRFSSSDEVFDYLLAFVNVERGQATVFKLDRMEYLAEKLGNPHLGRLGIHVAGSKGKGSVSTMCARILAEAGLTTGLYTSPHLLRWKERIAFADGEMPEEALIAAAEEVLPLIEGKNADDFPGEELPTFFELTTLIAFCAFRASGCAAQVIETGLGGRLDSTNIIDPAVSVITPIELEHTQFLGDTIGKIAFEKAGIIKTGKAVCIAPQKEEALRVFQAKAAEKKSALFQVGKDVAVSDIRLSQKGTHCRLGAGKDSSSRLAALLRESNPKGEIEIASPMIGAIQAQNMALASLGAACALPGLDLSAIRAGLARSRLSARFELIAENPPIVLDGAHTPESAHLALDSLNALFTGPKVLLFACAYDKRHAEMARILAPHFEVIVITKPGSFKQSDPRSVFDSFAALRADVLFEADTRVACVKALAEAQARKATLLVTGSFYLCAEAKTFFAQD